MDFNKEQFILLKMCITSLLCGPRADLWPFYGFFSLCTDVLPPSGLLREGGRLYTGYGYLCKRFSLYIKVNVYIERKPLMR